MAAFEFVAVEALGDPADLLDRELLGEFGDRVLRSTSPSRIASRTGYGGKVSWSNWLGASSALGALSIVLVGITYEKAGRTNRGRPYHK